MKTNKPKLILLSCLLFLSISSFVYVNYSFYHNVDTDKQEMLTSEPASSDNEELEVFDFETKLIGITLLKVKQFLLI